MSLLWGQGGTSGRPAVCSVLAKPLSCFHTGSGAVFPSTELFSNTALIFLKQLFLEDNQFLQLSLRKTGRGWRNERQGDSEVNETVVILFPVFSFIA